MNEQKQDPPQNEEISNLVDISVTDVCTVLPWLDDAIYCWHVGDDKEVKRISFDFEPQVLHGLYEFLRHAQSMIAMIGFNAALDPMTKILEPHYPKDRVVPISGQTIIGLHFAYNVFQSYIKDSFYSRAYPKIFMSPLDLWAIDVELLVVRDFLLPRFGEGEGYLFREYDRLLEAIKTVEWLCNELRWLDPCVTGFLKIQPVDWPK